MIHKLDVLIVGSGISGLSLAIKLKHKYRIGIICNNNIANSASKYAQGGIATNNFNNNLNSYKSHLYDTIKTGDGICNIKMTKFILENASDSIQWLINKGVKFTLNSDKNYHFNIEGGHSERRILHNLDCTGKVIQKTLINIIKKRSNILIYEMFSIIELIVKKNQCYGLYALNIMNNNIEIFLAKICVLASGGASGIYKKSTNPTSNLGEGISIAYNGGCRIANLEFTQFHPTCFYNKKDKKYLLISEAVRGEGGYLKINKTNERFMLKIHKDAELAPRDVLTRSIYNQMKQYNLEGVNLDIAYKGKIFIKKYFPNIYLYLIKQGIDISKDYVLITPAAHYTCGGIVVNKNSQTDVISLYAIGEVAYTGLHGANRLASNSLLECLVLAIKSSYSISSFLENQSYNFNYNKYNKFNLIKIKENIINDEINIIKNMMWKYMGIIRSNNGLLSIYKNLDNMQKQFSNKYKKNSVSLLLIKLRNMILLAKLMTKSAISRKESRGSHYNINYPNKNIEFENPTILNPNNNIN